MLKQRLIKLKETSPIKGRFQIIKTNSLTGDVISKTDWQDNLVVLGTNYGKDLILKRLNRDNTYTLNITHLDIGTSTTAPATTDTGLIAGVARTDKADGTISTNTLELRFFFASANLDNGTYREIGTFIDGTATLGTGRLFSRALFGSNYVKGTNEDTTIIYQFII